MGPNSKPRIPFHRAAAVGNELRYVAEVVADGQLAGDGPFSRKCVSLIAELLGAPTVLLTTSCTHALEMSALLLDLKVGDEILVSPFAFVTTAGAFALRGVRPVFVDIRPDTLNVDEKLVRNKVSKNTKAIVALHYAGVGCEMDELSRIAQDEAIAVVEDSAHGFLGSYRGRKLGTLGSLATLSFHQTKNFTCGEGGALIVNDGELVERAQRVHKMGTNKHDFVAGKVNEYTWVDFGSSYMPSEILAAFLLAQLERHAYVQEGRKRLWERYQFALRDWASVMGVRLPTIPEHCEQTYHMFYLILPSSQHRTGLISWLLDHGVLAAFHYLPLNASKMGLALSQGRTPCPVAEEISSRMVRLPMFIELTEAEQDVVIKAVLEYECR